MSLDILVLGSFVFTDFAVPELLPAGGRQQMRVHKMPGGDRIIDTMGPDDDDRQFSVLHVGEDALADALTLDAMRISGQPSPYSNGVEARIVVIAAAPFRVEKFNVVHQDLVLTPVDNPGGSSASASSSPDELFASDASAGQDIISGNATPVTTPQPGANAAGGIGSA
jgi:hypothetical protein